MSDCSIYFEPISPVLKLLAPAKSAAIGREAIRHGADAVYIGGPAFGARDKAGNAMSDIAALGGIRAPFPCAHLGHAQHHPPRCGAGSRAQTCL